MISLTVNGRPKELEREIGLTEYLRLSDIDTRMVAVAINGEVIPKREYDRIELHEGDAIEIVRMVGGG